MMLCFSCSLTSPAEMRLPILSEFSCKLLALDDFENGLALRANDRISAESVEVNALRERLRDFRRGHDRA